MNRAQNYKILTKIFIVFIVINTLLLLGQTFKFICGRWLGQNADDGSTERYMVGYPALSPSSLEKELTSANELSFSSEAPNQSSNSQDLIQLVQECSNNPPETTCPPMQLKVKLHFTSINSRYMT